MSVRHCWTCNNDHDPDEACRRSVHARPANLVAVMKEHLPAIGEAVTDFLFDNAAPASKFGPVFMAEFESEDSCCGEGIVPGEDIRADGHGGWIHADTTCERLASG